MMDARLVVLKKFLEEVDPGSVPAAGDSHEVLAEKHRRAQMVVYLAQSLAKVDLGYRAGWKTYLPWEEFLAVQDEQLAKDVAKAVESVKNVLATFKARRSHRPHRGIQRAIENLEEALWRIESAGEWLLPHGKKE